MTTQPQIENLIDIEERGQVATYKTFPLVVELDEDVLTVKTSDIWIFMMATRSSRLDTRMLGSSGGVAHH